MCNISSSSWLKHQFNHFTTLLLVGLLHVDVDDRSNRSVVGNDQEPSIHSIHNETLDSSWASVVHGIDNNHLRCVVKSNGVLVWFFWCFLDGAVWQPGSEYEGTRNEDEVICPQIGHSFWEVEEGHSTCVLF